MFRAFLNATIWVFHRLQPCKHEANSLPLQKDNHKQHMADKEQTGREIIQSYLISTARYRFTADEKRVLLHLIEMMQPLLEGKRLKGKVSQDLWGTYHFSLPISFFIDEANENKQTRIKNALRALNEKKFEYEDENEWRIIRLIEMPRLDKRGTVEFYLTPQLVDVFLNMSKGYTKFRLDIQLSFRSVHTMRFYELISNQRHPITYGIDKLKAMMGIPEGGYQRNFNFIERVIKPAKRELDDSKSNWTFEFKPIKQGRAFSAIEFTPIHHPEREPEEAIHADAMRRVNLSAFIDREMRRYLTGTCGFSQRELKNNHETIQKFANQCGEEAMGKLQEIWGRAITARNPKAYLIGSLKLEIET